MKTLEEKFRSWSQVSLEIHHSSPQHSNIKPGAIYWCAIGQNIGREENGKGSHFTRPVLVMKVLDSHLALVIPLSSQPKVANYYPKVIVAGRIDFALFNQIRTVDTLRLGDFIDEIDQQTFSELKHRLSQYLKL